MTQLEKFIALYREVGIELESEEHGDEIWLTMEMPDGFDCEGEGEDRSTPRIDGYPGFGMSIVFDREGRFLSQQFF